MSTAPDTPKHKPRLSLTRSQLEDPAALDLLQLLHSIIDDGRVTEAEIGGLSEWLRQHAESAIPGVSYLAGVVRGVLADGKVTPEERTWVQRAVETVLPAEVRQEAIARRREVAAEAQAQRVAAKEAARQAKAEEREQARLVRPVRTFDVMVAGAYYGNRQAVIRGVSEGDPITLAREPENPYSKNAITFLRQDGQRLGYLPEVDAAQMAPLIDGGARHAAEVMKILAGGRGVIPVVWGELYRAESNEGATSPRVPFVDTSTDPAPRPARPAPLPTVAPRPQARINCLAILTGVVIALVVAAAIAAVVIKLMRE